jgi:Na+/proline symporter
MITAVPHALKGFLIVAILSAAMSSVSSALTALASVSTMDFVHPFLKGRRPDGFFLAFSKLSTIGWAAALMLVAYLSREVLFVLNAAFSLRGLTSGALLGGLALAVFWKRGASGPVVMGMLLSLPVMIAISLRWLGGVQIDWPWFTLIGTTVTLTAASIARALWPKPAAQSVGPPAASVRIDR